MSFKKIIFSGLIWTAIDTFFLRGILFMATIVLARILGPADFGIVGMITVFITVGNSLVDSGLSASLIRTPEANDEDFSTVFYLNLANSLLIYLIVFSLAPYIADFFNQEILVNIIRLYCTTFIISAFSSIQLAILDKKMKFKKMMLCNIPGVVLGVIVGIGLGYFGFGVWSIVIMQLVTQLIQSIFLWFYSDWKPSLTFSKEKMKQHYGFGYKLMLSSLINTVFKNINNVVIGKFFSVQSLGFYERARTFNEYPVSALTAIIGKVSYPLLSRIQNEKERITVVYKQLLQFTIFIVTPIMLAFAAIAKPLFLLVLGPAWLPAVPFFKILSLASIFYPIHAFNLDILKVFGYSNLFLKLEIINKLILVLSIVIGFQFGIYGLVWTGVSSSIISLLINTYYSSGIVHYTIKEQLLDMLPVFFITIVMYFIISGTIYSFNTYSLYIQIIIPSLIGLTLYVYVNYLIKSAPFLLVSKLLKQRTILK